RDRGPRIVAVETGTVVHEKFRVEPRPENQIGLRINLARGLAASRLLRAGVAEIGDIKREVVGTETAYQPHPGERLQLQLHIGRVGRFLNRTLHNGPGRNTRRLCPESDIGDTISADLE